MKEKLKAPLKAEKQQKRTHCKCCRVSLAKARMPLTMEGLLAWHGRWLNAEATVDARGCIILDEQLIFSAGYPLPKREVLEDLWNSEHREIVGHERRRRLITDYKLVIHPKRVCGSAVNVSDLVVRRSWKVQMVPIFAQISVRGEL